MRTESKRWSLGVLALLVTLAAPEGLTGQESPGQEPQAGVEEATPASVGAALRIANHNWLDLHVYLSREGGPLQSLGMVTSHTTATFELPRESFLAGSALRVVADPIGGGPRYVSPELILSPGVDVHVAVENAIHLSSSTVRTRREEG